MQDGGAGGAAAVVGGGEGALGLGFCGWGGGGGGGGVEAWSWVWKGFDSRYPLRTRGKEWPGECISASGSLASGEAYAGNLMPGPPALGARKGCRLPLR